MNEANTNEPQRSKTNAARMTSLMKRANTLAEKGLYDEAIEDLKQAMALCPSEARCSVQLANIYRAQNRIGPAIEAYNKALELDPMDSAVQEQLLQILIDIGRYDEAISTSTKLLKAFPKNLYARDILGIAYVQQGRLDKAMEVTDELIRLAPADPAHYFKKAVLYQQRGEMTGAMQAFKQALDLDPEGELADEARESIAALDGYQLRQVLTIALDDAVFRAKLALDPEMACVERGFALSSAGIMALRQIDLDTLPGDATLKMYH